MYKSKIKSSTIVRPNYPVCIGCDESCSGCGDRCSSACSTHCHKHCDHNCGITSGLYALPEKNK